MPFFAAILKVRLSRMGEFLDINLVFADFHLYRACPNRKQGGTITRPFTPHQKSQI